MKFVQAYIGARVIVRDPVHFSRAADPLPPGQVGVITRRYIEDDPVWQVNLPGGITLFYRDDELDGLELATKAAAA